MRHFPKIRGGQAPPAWLLEHTKSNMHALGPTPEVLAEWNAAGLTLPDLPNMRRYRLARVRQQLEAVMPTALTGSVVRTEGLMTAVAGFPAPVGAIAEIRPETQVDYCHASFVRSISTATWSRTSLIGACGLRTHTRIASGAKC